VINALIYKVLKMDFFGWIILFTFAMTKCIKDKKLEA